MDHSYFTCMFLVTRLFCWYQNFPIHDSNCQGSLDKSPPRGPHFSGFDHIHPHPSVSGIDSHWNGSQTGTYFDNIKSKCMHLKKYINESEMMFFDVLYIFVILVEITKLISETFFNSFRTSVIFIFICMYSSRQDLSVRTKNFDLGTLMFDLHFKNFNLPHWWLLFMFFSPWLASLSSDNSSLICHNWTYFNLETSFFIHIQNVKVKVIVISVPTLFCDAMIQKIFNLQNSFFKHTEN